VRLDIWLWAARFFKTRSLAKHAIEGGKIEINDAPGRAAKAVRIGDRVRIRRGEETFVVDVAALSEQRGPASVAQALYRETEASREARALLTEQKKAMPAFDFAEGRPSKKDRTSASSSTTTSVLPT